jgi:hypothetical protein
MYRVADEPAAGSIRAGRVTVEDGPDVTERCLQDPFLGMDLRGTAVRREGSA